LASIYGVETRSLNRAVKRNRDRFPKDFVLQLTEDEWQNLKYQIGTSSSGHGVKPIRGFGGSGAPKRAKADQPSTISPPRSLPQFLLLNFYF